MPNFFHCHTYTLLATTTITTPDNELYIQLFHTQLFNNEIVVIVIGIMSHNVQFFNYLSINLLTKCKMHPSPLNSQVSFSSMHITKSVIAFFLLYSFFKEKHTQLFIFNKWAPLHLQAIYSCIYILYFSYHSYVHIPFPKIIIINLVFFFTTFKVIRYCFDNLLL